MSRSAAGALLLGLTLGVVLASAFALIRNASREEPRPEPPAPAPADAGPELVRQVEELGRENEELRARIAELEKSLASEKEKSAALAKAAEVPGPQEEARKSPSPPQERKDVFAALAKQGFQAFGSKDFHRAVELYTAAGPEGIRELAQILLTGPESGERFLAAAILGALKSGDAIPPLAEALGKEKNELVRRMASHALATMQNPAAADALRQAMNTDTDWGVRVNSSYGLAKLGDAGGLAVLNGFYTSPDLAPEYRLPVLGGLADVAAPSTAPTFRKILRETSDMAYLLISIGALEKMKDRESLTDLQALLGNPAVSEDVREAARKAIDAIRK